MKIDVKKLLLAGTAIVAVGATGVSSAKAADLTLTGDAVWGTAANGMVATPTAGDNVIMSTHALKFDTTETGVTTAGAITSTTGNLTVDTTGDAGNVAFTIGSFTGSSTADITVDNLDASTTRNVAANITGAMSTGGNLIVRNTETGGGSTSVALTVGGNTTVGGTTAISTVGTGQTGNTATVDLNGATNVFTGAVTVTGGANDASNDASLLISGASTTFTGGLTLTDGAVGQAILTLDGLTTAQTVAGNIAGNGDINVQNAAGVTFSGTVTSGTVLIENGGAALNSSATFQNTVNSAITLGAAGTGTNTVTFDTTTQAFTVTGAVAGAIAGETNNVVISGGKTLTQATGWTSNLDSVAVSGTGTKLDSNAAITATNVTVGSGATLDVGAGLLTGAVANSGTLQLTGAGGVTGDITGTGVVDVDATSTITGSIAAGSMTIAEAADLTVTAAAGARTITTSILLQDAASDGTDATLALAPGANGIDITGAITTQVNGEGEITIADGTGAVDFVGDVGTSAAKVGALTVAGGSNNVITTKNNYHVTTTTLNDADSFKFIGTTAQAVSGTFVGVAANDGAIEVGDGTNASNVTFSGIIGTGAGNDLGAFTINDNSTATFAANATFDGALSADKATIEVAAGSTLTAGTQTDADITTWNVQVNKVGGGAQTNGTVIFTGDAVNLATDTVHFVVNANSAPLTVGASVLDNVFQGNAGATIAGATVTDNSWIYGFTLVADTNNVDVTVALENSIESVTGNSGYDATGNQLITTLAGSTNTEINQLQSTLAAASTQAAANNVIEAAASDVSGGAVIGGLQVANSTAGINQTRLAALRSGDETGMAAGSVMGGLKAWIQGFGTTGEQDKRDGVSGYDVDSVGFAVGVDTETVAEDLTVGVAFAYANTDVESEAISNAETEIDSYQISLYGDYDLTNTAFITAQLGYMWSNNDTTRNPGGISSLVAKGDYDSDTFTVGATVGNDYAMGNGSMVLTPTVSANYMHYSADDYTETGAGGASLAVDADSLNVFELGLGVDATWSFEQANGSLFKPSVGLGVRHDLIGDEYQATNSFTGATTSFKVEGFDPAQTTFDAGVGFDYHTTSNWTLSADYNYEFKSDYDSHAGVVKASYKF